jgi:hypothetical protein
MASTRNNNTLCNYKLQVRANEEQRTYKLTDNQTLYPKWAGNGLIQGRMPNSFLSENTIEIESFLKGLNLTNLDKQYEDNVSLQPILRPELKSLPSYNLYHNQRVILPDSFHPETNQRPSLS